jgi:hypothetical protein
MGTAGSGASATAARAAGRQPPARRRRRAFRACHTLVLSPRPPSRHRTSPPLSGAPAPRSPPRTRTHTSARLRAHLTRLHPRAPPAPSALFVRTDRRAPARLSPAELCPSAVPLYQPPSTPHSRSVSLPPAPPHLSSLPPALPHLSSLPFVSAPRVTLSAVSSFPAARVTPTLIPDRTTLPYPL